MLNPTILETLIARAFLVELGVVGRHRVMSNQQRIEGFSLRQNRHRFKIIEKIIDQKRGQALAIVLNGVANVA